MERIAASERTRERLKALMSGHGEEGLCGLLAEPTCAASTMPGVAFGRVQGRSTGQTGRQEQRSSWAPRAIASRSAPLGNQHLTYRSLSDSRIGW